MQISITLRADSSVARVLILAAAVVACSCARTDSKIADDSGTIVDLPIGSPLSRGPGGAADRVSAGSPALILAKDSSGWHRFLTADGASGWSNAAVLGNVPVVIGARVSAVDRSPDEPAAANDVALAPPSRVIGASVANAVASLQENMFPPRRNWRNTPWLKLESGTSTGWVSPSEVIFNWTGDPRPNGMIRAPFTGRFSQLLDSAPRAGATVLRVDAAGEAASPGVVKPDEATGEVRAIQLDGDRRIAALFSGEKARVLQLASGALLFDTYLPELDRAICADLNGDGSTPCAAQVTQVTGDGPFTTLWIVTSATAAQAFRIDASSGEPGSNATEGEWWFDQTNHRLWIVRADSTSTKSWVVKAGKEVSSAAYLAMLPSRDNYDGAMADRIAVATEGLVVLPVSERGKIRWTAARIFASDAEAQRWTKASSLAPRLSIVALR